MRSVLAESNIRLATADDAARIAILSRDHVEHGLGWGWTPPRVLASIRDRATNVAVAYDNSELSGFGIMKYRDDEAHLNLLAVHPAQHRRGTGSALVRWLEAAAITAGIGLITVEARVSNTIARTFYRKLGYREMALLPRYYSGREDAIRIAKDLWA
jgi:ribosomal protein S18 acetylase RimI-like enzyme